MNTSNSAGTCGVNQVAWELRNKLLDLVWEFKALQQRARNEGQHGAAAQLDGVACQLAAIHEDLPDVFTQR